MAKPKLESTETELDMTPMIDLVFLLIIFFILAGKISSERRTEQITVPPTKTAVKIDNGRNGLALVNECTSDHHSATNAIDASAMISGEENQSWL